MGDAALQDNFKKKKITSDSHCLTIAPQYGVAMVTVPHWDARSENQIHTATMCVPSGPMCAE